MEIRNNPFEDRARQSNQVDITRPNRETIEKSNLDLTEKAAKAAEQKDRLDIDSSRILSARADQAAREADTERAERVRELGQAHQDGGLNSPERIQRSATRMLEGE